MKPNGSRTSAKRLSGQRLPNKRWLVVTESQGSWRQGFTHQCGTDLLTKSLVDEIVPYCPHCETVPDKVRKAK